MANKEIKIDPAVVNQKAGQMSNCTGQIEGVFNNIKIEVSSLKSVWDSDASRAFQSKFDALQDDIQRMIGVAREYSEDLVEISRTFTQIEQEAVQLEQALQDDVFHV